MPLIKICGITNVEDALVCVEAGSDMLGFNFYPASRRYIPPPEARQIIAKLPSTVLTIGVFVNAGSPDKVKQIAADANVGGVQFHGDETPRYCQSFSDRFVIKALRVQPEFDPAVADEYDVSAIMLDTFHAKARGGTGQSFDWSMAVEVRKRVPRLILAGGLTSENVAQAISTVQPYAVDVCSSLEATAGKKDPASVSNFTNLVRHLN